MKRIIWTIALLASFLPAVASAAISFDTSAIANGTSLSYTVGAGSGAILVVEVQNTNLGQTNGVTYNSVAMSNVSKIGTCSGSAACQSLWYLNNPTQGSAQNIVVSGGGGQTILAESFLGSAGILTPNFITGGATASLTTTAAGAWVVGSFAGSTSAITAGSGVTKRQGNQNFWTNFLGDSNGPKTPAGSYSMTGNNADNVIMLEIPLTNASASAPSSPVGLVSATWMY